MTATAKKTASTHSAKPVTAAPVATKVPAKSDVTAKTAPAASPAPRKPAAKRTTPIGGVSAKPLVKEKAKKAEKPVKEKKPKLIRDSFTIPKNEYTVLDDLKQRAGSLKSSVKKSELLRAGVKALAAMSDAAFLAALKAVPTIKTGRPKKD